MDNRLKAKVISLFNEPACAKNVAKGKKERRKGCGKPLTPGATAGGCAFDGSKIVLQPITDVIHIVHGPLACEGNGWDNRQSASSGSTLYRNGITTDLTQMDIIMGTGEKRLYKAIRNAAERFNPPAIFVYVTCVPALIGDDVEAVCKHAAQKLNIPVIPVNSPGFIGTKNLGNKLAGETLFDHVIGTMEPEQSSDTDINIIGEYNLSGELWQIKPLFDQLGIRVHSCITGDAHYRDVASAHRSRVNMMVCSAALINLARKMEEKWGIPFFEGSFYGIEETSRSLRKIAELLVKGGAAADLIDRTEALIEAEEKRCWERLEPYRQRLQGKRVFLYTGGVKSWSIVSALQQTGIEIVGTSVRKSTETDKEKIKKLMGSDAHMIEKIPPRDIYNRLKAGEADIMLSGGRTQFIALKAKIPWVDINQERHKAYAGYSGILALVQDIDCALSNPVWQEVRQPAPWEEGWEAPEIDDLFDDDHLFNERAS